MDFSEYNIQYVKGVGEKKAQLLNKLGIYSLEDLIHYYPRKYENWSETTTVANAPVDENVFIKATMITPIKESLIRKFYRWGKCY